MATRLKMYLLKSLRELVELPTEKLLAARYEKFRRMGQFLEGGAAPPMPAPKNGKPQ
jgi:acetyl-CoA carboxylase carboxyl transferase subunit alpha